MTSRLTRRGFLLGTALFVDSLAVAHRQDRGTTETPEAAASCESLTNARAALVRPVDYAHVELSDSFWSPKTQKVATKAIQALIEQTEIKSGRIRNFEKVARNRAEAHEGWFFEDSDVYKAIEAMAYSLRIHPSTAVEEKADEWIAKVVAAQQPDGYLNTYYTLTGLDKRWTDMNMHEDYCAGHLIEAGVAYYCATGKRKLLDAAIRFADHLDSTFRVPDRHWVSGHEEIELALMRLYRLTNEMRYLQLAQWYLEQRGRGFERGEVWEKGIADFCQNTVPVKEQKRISGHAVRAMYLYSATADVASVTGDQGYLQTSKTVWEDVVSRHMYLTGGVGTSGKNEGFSEDYDLPNEAAYCETCASVGMVFWNHRMALLTGESKYVDVLEKALYNGALDGLSLSGDRFFYCNPLASGGGSGVTGRREWLAPACCPSNIARLIASIGGYLYAVSDRGVWVNLFATSKARVKIGHLDIALQVATQYPWNGDIRITLDPPRPMHFRLHLRIPGWARAVATPGGLYQFTDPAVPRIEVRLNGVSVAYKDENGYAVLDGEWHPGDTVDFALPMSVKLVVARQEVKANRSRVALQRGPMIYCIEGADHRGSVEGFLIERSAIISAQADRIVDEDVIILRGSGSILIPNADGFGVDHTPQPMVAIPYYTWANRGNYRMRVWLPYRVADDLIMES